MEIRPIALAPKVRAAWTADGPPESLAGFLKARFSFFPRQVHGTRVAWVDAPGPDGFEADGLLTDVPDLLIGIRTADCLPILVAHRTESFAGAVHAGWRGLAGGILDALAGRIAENGLKIGDCTVFIGPGIGPCCYEVGPEVGKLFGRHFDGKRLNLRGFSRERLGSLGIPDATIIEETACTRCTATLPSYRRDPSCGRILTGIAIQNDNNCHP